LYTTKTRPCDAHIQWTSPIHNTLPLPVPTIYISTDTIYTVGLKNLHCLTWHYPLPSHGHGVSFLTLSLSLPRGGKGALRRHRRYDTTTTMPDPCSESLPPRGGEGVLRRHRRSAVGTTWAGWGSMPVVFFPGMAGRPCPTLRATSLSL
jgi:hypothetical protein